jgi:ABC-type multidrug transport system fused ATPase/permease subunit
VLRVESKLSVISNQLSVISEESAVSSEQLAVDSEKLAITTQHAIRNTQQAASRPLSVAFANVSFGYPDDEPDDLILHHLSFVLQPGRVLGLLGRTGSGKTTLIRLLFRLYDVSEGAICLGGNDVRHLPLQEVRRHVGMVTQNVQLFHASIRDNLTFFDHSIPDEMILRVLHDLGLKHWLDAQHQGLDTVLAASGGGLSAGEAQLLAFARVFLKDPGLVILDEASSRLDPVTEQLIEQAIDKLLHHRTAIIIAHRLGTVERADEILILENGRILEHAPRRQLATDTNSRFYQLLQTGIEEVLV